MQKFYPSAKHLFSFCIVSLLILTGCETTLENANDLTNAQDNYQPLYELSGTSWKMQVPGNIVIRERFVMNGETTTNTVTQFSMSMATSEITFNSDGTLTASYQNLYNDNWDNRWVSSSNVIFTPEHEASGTTSSAYTGYAGQFCNDVSNIQVSGLWKKARVHDDALGLDTWVYAIKILTSHAYVYTVDETQRIYGTACTAVDETVITYEDSDTLWENGPFVTSVGTSANEKEIDINMNSGSLSFLGDGTYTQQ